MSPERSEAGDRASEPPASGLSVTPLLGGLAVFASLLDLAINRVALRTLGETLDHGELIALSRWGHVPRNLAAIAGLVSLTLALISFLRTPMHAPVRRRLSIAGFAGIFLPTTALATLLPAERTSSQIVLFAIGAANVLAVLLGLTAARRSAPWGIRIGVGLVAVSAFFAFAALVLTLVEPIAHTQLAFVGSTLFRRVGEVCFLIAPLAVGASIAPRGSDTRDRVALGAAALALFGMVAIAWWGAATLRSDLPVVLYGAERVELLLESGPLVYLVVFAVTVAVGVAGLASADPARRQAGIGVLLLFAGGYAARSPGRLLMTVLAVALLARACIAMAERAVSRRAEESREDRDSLTAEETSAQAKG